MNNNMDGWNEDVRPRSSRREFESGDFVVEAAYKKAEALLVKGRIDMESFKPPQGNYDPEMVDRDIQIVAAHEERFAYGEKRDPSTIEPKRMATVFEALVCEQINENMWFGGNGRMTPASKYDDYENGVDGILNILESGRNNFLALGIDVTFSGKQMEEKIDNIVSQIDRNEMATVKYFVMPDGTYKGELRRVPRIVLAAEVGSVKQLAEQWAAGENQKLFKNHWMQFQLLEMAIKQCEAFGSYASRRNLNDVSSAYDAMKRKIESIYNLRKKFITMPQDRDKMMKRIEEALPSSLA